MNVVLSPRAVKFLKRLNEPQKGRIIKALDAGDNKTASDLQIVMQDKISELVDLYITYKKNLF